MLTRIGCVVALVGCTSVPTEMESQELNGSCGYNYCGTNSPEINHYGFHELNLDHAWNAQRVRLLGASIQNTFYDVDVRDSALSLIDAYGSRITGSKLVGATLWIAIGRTQFGIVVDDLGYINEVVPGGVTLESYVLDWSAVLKGPLPGVVHAGWIGEAPTIDTAALPDQHVCPAPDINGYWEASAYEWDESAVLAPYHSILFEGDRIDDATRTVDPRPDDRWFNIGCGRHTLAKMRLTRNTLHTVLSNGWAQVQATLKMLSADYCGNGNAFTVSGEPLVWRNNVNMSFVRTPTDLEARWNEYGVTCLYDPRLRETKNPEALKQFPDIWTAITDSCGSLPKCQDPDPYADHGELIVSGNY